MGIPWRHLGRAGALAVVLATAGSVTLGCASATPQPVLRFAYFAIAGPIDAWSPKIAGWQRRERLDTGAPIGVRSAAREAGPAPSALGAVSDAEAASAEGSGAFPEPVAGGPETDLRTKYFRFRDERRREIAREFAEWVQSEAKRHYVADGPIDHWATLEETLRADGDDCDGLELLAFHGLRDLGFQESEVFRAIVYRPSDGQHHMVTLWFEDTTDPWVIDPTGAMTTGMPRMSELPEWVPLKVFSDTVEYTVRVDAVAAKLASND